MTKTTLVRYLRAAAIGRDEPGAAEAFASSQNWNDASRVVSQIRAGASGVGMVPAAAGPLMLDLAEMVRPLTIVGRLPGVRTMPFNSRLIGMTAGVRAVWVRPGQAIPLSGVNFSSPVDLGRRAVAALIVTTEESLRDANPAVERALTADLVAAVATAIDESFIDIANSGSDSTPAAITHGGFSTTVTGSTVDDIIDNLSGLAEELSDAGGDLAQCTWALHPRTATFLSALRGTGGAPVFPGMRINGGTLLGLPALVSAAVPMEASPATTQISLIDGSGLTVADDGHGELALSRHSNLEMDDDPSGDGATPTAGSKHRVSMFQVDAVGIRAVRHINWLPRRATVAATLTSVPY